MSPELSRNSLYRVDDRYDYYTDNLGRVDKVEGRLELGQKDRNTYQQVCAGGDCRGPTDQGGHLIASIFNGPGEGLNLVPMERLVNQSRYKTLENTWKQALLDGKAVDVKIEPVYSGNSKRPDGFKVEYQIDGNITDGFIDNY
ncbi:DNA/RNA non-specific endonuclease [Terasakiella sp.]|uniref:DNA/RNA non-specific endonuclease n=1 Tax=Terasakiella sp. TaxID=2034861 RepID=UPI003AA8AF63